MSSSSSSSSKRKADDDAPAVLFDADTELDDAITDTWELSPEAFRIALNNDNVSVDAFKVMAHKLRPEATPAKLRLQVLTTIADYAGELVGIMPESKVDFNVGLNERIMEGEYDTYDFTLKWIPEWRRNAHIARTQMEAEAAASPDGEAIRAAFALDIQQQLAREQKAVKRRRRLIASKARVLLDGVYGDDGIHICICTGVGRSISELHSRPTHNLDFQPDEMYTYWIEGMRLLFGSMLARCSRAMLVNDDLSSGMVVTLWNRGSVHFNIPARREQSRRWLIGSCDIYANPMRVHRLIIRNGYLWDPLMDLWDQELENHAAASNATVLLGSIRTQDGRPLYDHAIQSISRMISPDTLLPQQAREQAASKHVRLRGKLQLVKG